MQKNIIVIFVIFFVVLVSVAWIFQTEKKQTGIINNFADCVKAGYPVILVFPQKCLTPNGEIFIEKISADEESQAEKIATSAVKNKVKKDLATTTKQTTIISATNTEQIRP